MEVLMEMVVMVWVASKLRKVRWFWELRTVCMS